MGKEHIEWLIKLGVSQEVFEGRAEDSAAIGAALPDPELVGPGGTNPDRRPMLPDCKPIKGKVPGPVNHLLCSTHKHVVDVDERVILADSLEEYIRKFPRGASGGGKGSSGGGDLPQPMQEDCKPVKGKVPGPVHHLLCSTHNHVVDVNAKTIIAASVVDYQKRFPRGGGKAPAGGRDGRETPVMPELPAVPKPSTLDKLQRLCADALDTGRAMLRKLKRAKEVLLSFTDCCTVQIAAARLGIEEILGNLKAAADKLSSLPADVFVPGKGLLTVAGALKEVLQAVALAGPTLAAAAAALKCLRGAVEDLLADGDTNEAQVLRARVEELEGLIEGIRYDAAQLKSLCDQAKALVQNTV